MLSQREKHWPAFCEILDLCHQYPCAFGLSERGMYGGYRSECMAPFGLRDGCDLGRIECHLQEMVGCIVRFRVVELGRKVGNKRDYWRRALSSVRNGWQFIESLAETCSIAFSRPGGSNSSKNFSDEHWFGHADHHLEGLGNLAALSPSNGRVTSRYNNQARVID
jgi:hypothetical protein